MNENVFPDACREPRKHVHKEKNEKKQSRGLCAPLLFSKEESGSREGEIWVFCVDCSRVLLLCKQPYCNNISHLHVYNVCSLFAYVHWLESMYFASALQWSTRGTLDFLPGIPHCTCDPLNKVSWPAIHHTGTICSWTFKRIFSESVVTNHLNCVVMNEPITRLKRTCLEATFSGRTFFLKIVINRFTLQYYTFLCRDELCLIWLQQ